MWVAAVGSKNDSLEYLFEGLPRGKGIDFFFFEKELTFMLSSEVL